MLLDAPPWLVTDMARGLGPPLLPLPHHSREESSLSRGLCVSFSSLSSFFGFDQYKGAVFFLGEIVVPSP